MNSQRKLSEFLVRGSSLGTWLEFLDLNYSFKVPPGAEPASVFTAKAPNFIFTNDPSYGRIFLHSLVRRCQRENERLWASSCERRRFVHTLCLMWRLKHRIHELDAIVRTLLSAKASQSSLRQILSQLPGLARKMMEVLIYLLQAVGVFFRWPSTAHTSTWIPLTWWKGSAIPCYPGPALIFLRRLA